MCTDLVGNLGCLQENLGADETPEPPSTETRMTLIILGSPVKPSGPFPQPWQLPGQTPAQHFQSGFRVGEGRVTSPSPAAGRWGLYHVSGLPCWPCVQVTLNQAAHV